MTDTTVILPQRLRLPSACAPLNVCWALDYLLSPASESPAVAQASRPAGVVLTRRWPHHPGPPHPPCRLWVRCRVPWVCEVRPPSGGFVWGSCPSGATPAVFQLPWCALVPTAQAPPAPPVPGFRFLSFQAFAEFSRLQSLPRRGKARGAGRGEKGTHGRYAFPRFGPQPCPAGGSSGSGA